MKKNTLKKKLTLGKMTIADIDRLDASIAKEVKGGDYTGTCCTSCCSYYCTPGSGCKICAD